MFQTNLTCNLWDLVDEGIDTVLARLKGETGITGITVPLSCGPTIQLRPHAGVSPRTFRSKGGIQFQPDPAQYAATRVRPVVAEWLRKSNPITQVIEATNKYGLPLRVIIECCQSPITVERHEHAAIKDVFGDINPNWLCPANPDVREYLRSLVREIDAKYHPEALELDSLCFEPGNIAKWIFITRRKEMKPDSIAGEITQLKEELASWKEAKTLSKDVMASARKTFNEINSQISNLVHNIGQWLHTLCFCESCRQAATRDGVDMNAAARSTTDTLERIFATGDRPEQSMKDFLNNDHVLTALVEWRCAQITSLFRTLRESCQCKLLLSRWGSREDTGIDQPAMTESIDGLISRPFDFDDKTIERSIRHTTRITGDPTRAELEFDIRIWSCPDSATLVRAVSKARTLGIHYVTLTNYGEIPLNRLHWIKQATRYAQRESM